MREITGYIEMPFHGESAYEIAKKYGYVGSEEEWVKGLGHVNDDAMEDILEHVAQRTHGFTWYVDTDSVADRENKTVGKLSDCMNDDFAGTWFFVRTTQSEAGSAKYPDKYTIDGANGYLSLRDYVVWTGLRLVHVSTFEAKASSLKNADGKYSPKSGVDGLQSSTDKAYLGDLIAKHWGRDYLPVYKKPDPNEGWQVNWLFDEGWYMGGIKKDCGGHPPVLSGNHTSWAVLVLRGMATDAESLNRNHMLQIAYDLVNSKIYMRRGWMSSKTWADTWSDISPSPVSHLGNTFINWITVEGVHYVTLEEGNGSNPILDDDDRKYVVFVGREFDGKNFTDKKFQLARHVKSGKCFYRSAILDDGGSFGGYAWQELSTKLQSDNIAYPGEEGKILGSHNGEVMWIDMPKNDTKKKFFVFNSDTLTAEYDSDTFYITGIAADEEIQKMIIPKLNVGEMIDIRMDSRGGGNTQVWLSVKDDEKKIFLGNSLSPEITNTTEIAVNGNCDYVVTAITSAYYCVFSR